MSISYIQVEKQPHFCPVLRHKKPEIETCVIKNMACTKSEEAFFVIICIYIE